MIKRCCICSKEFHTKPYKIGDPIKSSKMLYRSPNCKTCSPECSKIFTRRTHDG